VTTHSLSQSVSGSRRLRMWLTLTVVAMTVSTMAVSQVGGNLERSAATTITQPVEASSIVATHEWGNDLFRCRTNDDLVVLGALLVDNDYAQAANHAFLCGTTP
jgi:hypothetical protein